MGLETTLSPQPATLGSWFDSKAVQSSDAPNPLPRTQIHRPIRRQKWATVAKNRSKRYRRGHHPKVCPECGTGFDGLRKEQKYCSRKCVHAVRAREQVGAGNPGWKGGISRNHYHYKRLQKERYPERIKARQLVFSAIRSGKLVRGNCEACGKEKGHAHHDDYSKPLEVRWFCRKHHRQLHGGRI